MSGNTVGGLTLNGSAGTFTFGFTTYLAKHLGNTAVRISRDVRFVSRPKRNGVRLLSISGRTCARARSRVSAPTVNPILIARRTVSRCRTQVASKSPGGP